jgi:hypothetical protein
MHLAKSKNMNVPTPPPQKHYNPQGTEGGIIAAKAGHDVIMTPTSHCYFDYRQAQRWGLGVSFLCVSSVVFASARPTKPCRIQRRIRPHQEHLLNGHTPKPNRPPTAPTAATAPTNNRSPSEPGAWYACLPLEVVYSFDPLPPPSRHGAATAAAAAGEGGGRCSVEQRRLETEGSDGEQQQQQQQQQQEGAGSGPDKAAADAGQQQAARPSLDDPQHQQGLLAAERPANGTSSNGVTGGTGGTGGRPDDPYRRHILGGQANLWTEYVPDEATVEYMLLPRLSAMAEALW